MYNNVIRLAINAGYHNFSHHFYFRVKIEIDNIEIPCVTSTKLLGVHFDQQLTWNEQIKHVHKKISSNVYLLKQIKKIIYPWKPENFSTFSSVLPHFDYCSIIWGNCSKTAITKLVKIIVPGHTKYE